MTLNPTPPADSADSAKSADSGKPTDSTKPTGSAELTNTWPRLPLEEWEDTLATLHRLTQIVGKTKLALAPMQNHWWQVALHVTARGLTTTPLPYRDHTFEIEFDFIDHVLAVRASDGTSRTLPLAARPVSAFYEEYMALLRSLGFDVRIRPRPVEIASATPFPDDREHASYDADAVQRCWRLLSQADRVLKEFRGRFIGKSSPVHFWWGSFDLAHTRYSGRGAPPHPGGIPNTPDSVTREAYSHECMSVGWWPGGGGAPILEPAFYAYAYPEPPGCPEAPVGPSGASYNPVLREWVLPYETVRRAADPDAALLEFAQTTYEAVAGLGAWDRAALERSHESQVERAPVLPRPRI